MKRLIILLLFTASGMARHASEWLLNAVPQPCQLSA